MSDFLNIEKEFKTGFTLGDITLPSGHEMTNSFISDFKGDKYKLSGEVNGRKSSAELSTSQLLSSIKFSGLMTDAENTALLNFEISSLEEKDVSEFLHRLYSISDNDLGSRLEDLTNNRPDLKNEIDNAIDGLMYFAEDSDNEFLSNYAIERIKLADKSKFLDEVMSKLLDGQTGVQLKSNQTTNELFALLGPDASHPGSVRATFFDKNGFSGHVTHNDYEELMKDIISQGFTLDGAGALEKLSQLQSFNEGNAAIAEMQAESDRLFAEAEKDRHVRSLYEDLEQEGATLIGNSVKVFHITNAEAAAEIIKTGLMRGAEDGVFFTTKENGQAEGYGDTVLEFNIPLSEMQIDDAFGDEAHLRIPTKRVGDLVDVSKWVVDRPTEELEAGHIQNKPLTDLSYDILLNLYREEVQANGFNTGDKVLLNYPTASNSSVEVFAVQGLNTLQTFQLYKTPENTFSAQAHVFDHDGNLISSGDFPISNEVIAEFLNSGNNETPEQRDETTPSQPIDYSYLREEFKAKNPLNDPLVSFKAAITLENTTLDGVVSSKSKSTSRPILLIEELYRIEGDGEIYIREYELNSKNSLSITTDQKIATASDISRQIRNGVLVPPFVGEGYVTFIPDFEKKERLETIPVRFPVLGRHEYNDKDDYIQKALEFENKLRTSDLDTAIEKIKSLNKPERSSKKTHIEWLQELKNLTPQRQAAYDEYVSAIGVIALNNDTYQERYETAAKEWDDFWGKNLSLSTHDYKYNFHQNWNQDDSNLVLSESQIALANMVANAVEARGNSLYAVASLINKENKDFFPDNISIEHETGKGQIGAEVEKAFNFIGRNSINFVPDWSSMFVIPESLKLAVNKPNEGSTPSEDSSLDGINKHASSSKHFRVTEGIQEINLLSIYVDPKEIELAEAELKGTTNKTDSPTPETIDVWYNIDTGRFLLKSGFSTLLEQRGGTVEKAIANAENLSNIQVKANIKLSKSLILDDADDPIDTLLTDKESDEYHLGFDHLDKVSIASKMEEEAPEPDIGKKISDYGEKVPGAIKDRWVNFMLKLNKYTDPNLTTLANYLPSPNYASLFKKGISKDKLALAALAITVVPKGRGITTRRQIQEQCYTATIAKEALTKIISIEELKQEDIDDVISRLAEGSYWGKDRIETMFELIKTFEPEHYKKLSNLKIEKREDLLKLESGLYDQNTKIEVFALRLPTDKHIFRDSFLPFEEFKDGLQSKVEKFLNTVAAPREAQKTKFSCFTDRATKIRFAGYELKNTNLPRDERIVNLKSFPAGTSVKQVFEYIGENREDLENQIEKLKTIEMRSTHNRIRIGSDWREGHISNIELRETFGLKWVEFGASLPEIEKQDKLNLTYDALCDLCLVTGIERKAIGLGGSLSQGFATRGTGGRRAANASYFPGVQLINLTRRNGAGSLAHEVFHAIDHHFGIIGKETLEASGAEIGSIPQEYATDPKKGGRDFLREEMREAFEQLSTAISDEDFKKRFRAMDGFSTKLYWSTPIEIAARSFEKYVKMKLAETGAENDFLVNIYEDITTGQGRAYPSNEEMESLGITKAFDNLFEKMKTIEVEKGLSLYKLNTPEENLKNKWSSISSQLDNSFNKEHLSQEEDIEFSDLKFDLSAKGDLPKSYQLNKPDYRIQATRSTLSLSSHLVDYGDSGSFFVYEDNEFVWVDLNSLNQDDVAGSGIHQLLADYSFAGGKQYCGDPQQNIHTKVEHMLASAIRFGTAEHLSTGRELGYGAASGDIKWGYNENNNLTSLLLANYEVVSNANPEISEIIYSEISDTFEINTEADSKLDGHRVSVVLDLLNTKNPKKSLNTQNQKLRIKLANAILSQNIIARDMDLASIISLPSTEKASNGILFNPTSNTSSSNNPKVLEVRNWIERTEIHTGTEINVVATTKDLPTHLSRSVPDNISGIYDTNTQNAYLIANNIRDKEHAVKTALHEGIGHRGVINFLERNSNAGGSETIDVLDQIFIDIGETEITKELDSYSLDMSKAEDRRTAVLEYIAHLAESDYSNQTNNLIDSKTKLLENLYAEDNIKWNKSEIINLIEAGRLHLIYEESIKQAASTGFEFNTDSQAYHNAFKSIIEQTPSLKTLLDRNNNEEIIAWHGTPNEIKKFNVDFRGTGEGYQAYGDGIYAAGSEKVGTFYQHGIANSSTDVNGKRYNINDLQDSYKVTDPEFFALDYYIRGGANWIEAERLLIEDVESNVFDQATPNNLSKEIIIDTMSHLEKHISPLDGRFLYQVKLAIADDNMLDLDKPLEEQSLFVRTALGPYLGDLQITKLAEDILPGWKVGYIDELKSIGLSDSDISAHSLAIDTIVYDHGKDNDNEAAWEVINSISPDEIKTNVNDLYDIANNSGKNYYGVTATGQFIYDQFMAKGITDSAIDTSILLSNIGIKGNKYLNGLSRDKATLEASADDYNYVVFDGNDISITNDFSKTNDNLAARGIDVSQKASLQRADILGFSREIYYRTGEDGQTRYTTSPKNSVAGGESFLNYAKPIIVDSSEKVDFLTQSKSNIEELKAQGFDSVVLDSGDGMASVAVLDESQVEPVDSLFLSETLENDKPEIDALFDRENTLYVGLKNELSENELRSFGTADYDGNPADEIVFITDTPKSAHSSLDLFVDDLSIYPVNIKLDNPAIKPGGKSIEEYLENYPVEAINTHTNRLMAYIKDSATDRINYAVSEGHALVGVSNSIDIERFGSNLSFRSTTSNFALEKNPTEVSLRTENLISAISQGFNTDKTYYRGLSTPYSSNERPAVEWLTTSLDYAKEYATQSDGSQGFLYEAYTKLTSPFELGFRDSKTLVQAADICDRLERGVLDQLAYDVITSDQAEELMETIETFSLSKDEHKEVFKWVAEHPEVKDILIQAGYDSIITNEGPNGVFEAVGSLDSDAIKYFDADTSFSPPEYQDVLWKIEDVSEDSIIPATDLSNALKKHPFSDGPFQSVLSAADGSLFELSVSKEGTRNKDLIRQYGQDSLNMASAEIELPLNITQSANSALSSIRNSLIDMGNQTLKIANIKSLSFGNIKTAGKVLGIDTSLIASNDSTTISTSRDNGKLAGFAGARFIFAGRNSSAIPQGSYQKAMDMLDDSNGSFKEMVAITRDTGWSVGIDGKLRFEISDKESTVVQEFLEATKRIDAKPEALVGYCELGQFFKHDTLYEHYPALKTLNLNFIKTNEKSLFKGGLMFDTSGRNTHINIYCNSDTNPNDVRKTLVHEIQHFVQFCEGFALGGVPDYSYLDNCLEKAITRLDRVINRQADAKWNTLTRERAALEDLQIDDTLKNLMNDPIANKNAHKLFELDIFAVNEYKISYDTGSAPDESNTEEYLKWVQLSSSMISDIHATDFRARNGVDINEYKNDVLQEFGRRGVAKRIRAISEDITEIRESLRANNFIREKMDKLVEAKNDLTPQTASRYYRLLGGEAEARLVSARLDFHPLSLKYIPQSDSLDVDQSKLINYREMANTNNLIIDKKTIEDRIKNLANEPGEILVVSSKDFLPSEVVDLCKSYQETPSGVRHLGKIYIVADQIKSIEDLDKTLIHELAHKGVNSVFGESLSDTYQVFWNQAGGESGLKALSDDNNIDLSSYFSSSKEMLDKGLITSEERQSMLVDEFIAHMVVNRNKLDPTEKAKVIEAEFIGGIRNSYRAAGILNDTKMTSADLAFTIKAVNDSSRGLSAHTPLFLNIDTKNEINNWKWKSEVLNVAKTLPGAPAIAQNYLNSQNKIDFNLMARSKTPTIGLITMIEGSGTHKDMVSPQHNPEMMDSYARYDGSINNELYSIEKRFEAAKNIAVEYEIGLSDKVVMLGQDGKSYSIVKDEDGNFEVSRMTDDGIKTLSKGLSTPTEALEDAQYNESNNADLEEQPTSRSMRM